MPIKAKAIAALADPQKGWRPVWEGSAILAVVGKERAAISAVARQPPPPFTAAPVRNALALHSDHALVRGVPDWGNFRLTEPQATKGLAHLIGGNPARMRGLLDGLGVDASEEEVAQATIEAEKHRIDLLIRLPQRAIIVEAKFGHRVTAGQLSTYWTKTAPGAQAQGVLLLIDPETVPDLHHKQRGKWPARSWASLLIALERAMAAAPGADDEDFRLFRRLLWRRVDGLSMRTHP